MSCKVTLTSAESSVCWTSTPRELSHSTYIHTHARMHARTHARTHTHTHTHTHNNNNNTLTSAESSICWTSTPRAPPRGVKTQLESSSLEHSCLHNLFHLRAYMKNELYLTYMCWLFVQMYKYFVMKSLNKYIIFKERTVSFYLRHEASYLCF